MTQKNPRQQSKKYLKKKYFVKVRANGLDVYDVVGKFNSFKDAEQLKERLLNGYGGLFGQHNSVWIDTNMPIRRKK